MSWQGPNLARVPFLNLRALRRSAATLAVAALLLTGWNVFTYEQAGSGAVARNTEIQRLEGEIAAAARRLATIENDLAARDLEADNRRAAFLNDRIEERTFSWNALFDRLGEALPRQVRLHSLSPSIAGARGTGRRQVASVRTPVVLRISGEAAHDEALLEFIDQLFAHASFQAPNLQHESRGRAGAIDFRLTVVFYPEALP